MEVIHPRCAGIDVSKKDAKVCIRIQGRGPRRPDIPPRRQSTAHGPPSFAALCFNSASRTTSNCHGKCLVEKSETISSVTAGIVVTTFMGLVHSVNSAAVVLSDPEPPLTDRAMKYWPHS
jgi:hypothetical protein